MNSLATRETERRSCRTPVDTATAPERARVTALHLVWGGDVGGIQRLVKRAFLDEAPDEVFHRVLILSNTGSVICKTKAVTEFSMRGAADILRFLPLRNQLRCAGDRAVIVLHSDTPLILAALPADVPVIYVEHGGINLLCRRRLLTVTLLSRLFSRVFRIVCVSAFIEQSLVNAVPKASGKTVIVKPPCLVDTVSTARRLRSPPVFGFIGRLTDVKGPLDFIACAHLLAFSVPGATFIMIGDGPLGEECRKRARALGLPIRFTGAVADVTRYIDECDVAVMSSREDSFNVAALECMGRGVPVASYRRCGLAELITDGVTGAFAQSADPEGLADACRAIVADPSRYAVLSNSAAAFAREHFGIGQFRRLWRETIKSAVYRSGNSVSQIRGYA